MNEFHDLDSNIEVDIEVGIYLFGSCWLIANCLVQKPAIPIPLTSAKGPSLTALKFEFNSCLPEYPTSHIDGYAYVVESGGRSQVEMEQLVHDVSTSQLLCK